MNETMTITSEQQDSIRAMMEQFWQYSESRGFHAPDVAGHVITFVERLALIHSEVSEALEAYRELGNLKPTTNASGKPEGVPSELADVFIRVLECARHHDVDLAAAVAQKMAYNQTRPYRHGGKAL